MFCLRGVWRADGRARVGVRRVEMAAAVDAGPCVRYLDLGVCMRLYGMGVVQAKIFLFRERKRERN